MTGNRLQIVLVSAFVSLAIAAAGSYFGFAAFWTQNNNMAQHELPQHAEGATHVISTSAYLGQPDDFSNLLARSDVVVEGVISQLFTSRWSTEDGTAPADLKSDDVRDLSVHIRTPVELSVKRVFKGESVGDTIKFSFVGGRVGDVAHTFPWNEVFEKNARVIVFLAKGIDGSPAHNVEAQAYFPRIQLVVNGDEADGPTNTIKMTDLLEQIQ